MRWRSDGTVDSGRPWATVRPGASGQSPRRQRGRLGFAGAVVVLGAVLALGLVGTGYAGAEPAGVPPVRATYHGVKPYNTFAVGQVQYDAWTYGDIAFYSPPGMVTQEMADQWLAWYATTDDILRTIIGDDEDFEARYRADDPNFGRVKVIGTPTDSCGAGCGNKAKAEGVGIIDDMVAEPDNYEHHWILFYEQARGGRDEPFDLAASWPREAYHLPHLVAALTFHEIDGVDGLRRGVPGDIHRGLQKWADHGRSYVDVFVEREQRWFADGTIIYPPQTSILLHLAVNDGVDTLTRVFDNLGQYPDNLMYADSTSAICDWQAAVNDATGNAHASRMVDEWHLPGPCSYDRGRDSSGAHHVDDLRFEANGFCADPSYKPGTAQVGHVPCDGSDGQRFAVAEDRGDGTFLLSLGEPDRCLDASGTNVVTWSCHGGGNQLWQWSGDRLQQPGTDLCVAANPRTRWGGGTLAMEPCADSPTQRINTGGLSVTTTTAAPPTTAPPTTATTTGPATTKPVTATVPSTVSSSPVSSSPVSSTTVARPPSGPVTTRPLTTTTGSTTTGSTTTGPPTTPAPPSDWASGPAALVNVGSGRCIDQGPMTDANAGNVVQWRCAGHTQTNQLLTAIDGRGGVMLSFGHSGKCLDDWDGNLIQWTCHGGDNQIFTWLGSQLQVDSTDLCVTVSSESVDDGADLIAAPCRNSPFQQFRLETYGGS
ncbi:MAG: RICIN domain-containing protein [Actinomycetota bacterium]